MSNSTNEDENVIEQTKETIANLSQEKIELLRFNVKVQALNSEVDVILESIKSSVGINHLIPKRIGIASELKLLAMQYKKWGVDETLIEPIILVRKKLKLAKVLFKKCQYYLKQEREMAL
ncbi:MAG: hypothetical protein KZQ83_19080 [gamma proteobacterium symbiont of Taylorina sp.]|nr:hypothetical protein [gamma proteobacterium symbiont of Taylorina sp.]